MNDPVLMHTGQVMLAMEVLSVREYWQVRMHNRDHFPPIIQDTGVVGQIAEENFYTYTLNWPCAPNVFPMRHACLVGIQVIPITAVSRYWMDQVCYKCFHEAKKRIIHMINGFGHTVLNFRHFLLYKEDTFDTSYLLSCTLSLLKRDLL